MLYVHLSLVPEYSNLVGSHLKNGKKVLVSLVIKKALEAKEFPSTSALPM